MSQNNSQQFDQIKKQVQILEEFKKNILIYEQQTKSADFFKQGILEQICIPTRDEEKPNHSHQRTEYHCKKIDCKDIEKYSRLYQKIYNERQRNEKYLIKQCLNHKIKFRLNLQDENEDVKLRKKKKCLSILQKIKENNQNFILPRYFQFSQYEDGIQFTVERGLTFPIVDKQGDHTDCGFNLVYSFFSKPFKKKFIKDIQQNVEQLHKLKLQHCDIKVQNVIYSIIDNRFKLIDFSESIDHSQEINLNYKYKKDSKLLNLMKLKLFYRLQEDTNFDLGYKIKEACKNFKFRNWPEIRNNFVVVQTILTEKETQIINCMQDLIQYLEDNNGTLQSQDRYHRNFQDSINNSSKESLQNYIRGLCENKIDRVEIQKKIQYNQNDQNNQNDLNNQNKNDLNHNQNIQNYDKNIQNNDQNNQSNQRSKITSTTQASSSKKQSLKNPQQQSQNVQNLQLSPIQNMLDSRQQTIKLVLGKFLIVIIVIICVTIVILFNYFSFFSKIIRQSTIKSNLIQKYIEQLPDIEVVQLQDMHTNFIYETQKYLNFLPNSLNILTKTYASSIIARQPSAQFFKQFYNSKVIIQKGSTIKLQRTSNLSSGDLVLLQPSILHGFTKGVSLSQKNNPNLTDSVVTLDKNILTFYQLGFAEQIQQKYQNNMQQGYYYHQIYFKNVLSQNNYLLSQILQVLIQSNSSLQQTIQIQINDINLYENGSIYLDNLLGNIILVNGKSWPFKYVLQQQYILNIINLCKFRNLTLYLETEAKQIIPFQLSPNKNSSEITQYAFLPPFSMISIKVDFSNKSSFFYLRNRIQQTNNTSPSEISLNSMLQSQSTTIGQNSKSDSQVMKFIVNANANQKILNSNEPSQKYQKTIQYFVVIIGIIFESFFAIIAVFMILIFINFLWRKCQQKLRKNILIQQRKCQIKLQQKQELPQSNLQKKKIKKGTQLQFEQFVLRDDSSQVIFNI